MAAAAYICTNLSSLSLTSPIKAPNHICSIPCPNFFRPNWGSPTICRLKVSNTQGKRWSGGAPAPVVSCLVDDDSGGNVDLSDSSVSVSSNSEVSVDTKLPRRSLLVQFTCNACNERSERLINRLAYDKGTVFVQCSGCQQYHKLVDNLHLVVEYDFREDVDVDSNTHQV